MIECGHTNNQITSMKYMDTFIPVVRQSRLSVQVAEQIQKLVLQNKLQVGHRLPSERELTENFRVSRTVIREAIRILEAKGLLESQGGNGTFVRGVQSNDVANSLGMYFSTGKETITHAELMEVRNIFEIEIARLATERITPEGIQKLERLLEGMRNTAEHADEFAKFDLEFHLELARATNNRLMEVLLDPLIDGLYEERRLASMLPGIAEEAIGLHAAILEKIRSGDANGAAMNMQEHLEQANRVITKALHEFGKELKE
jgi:GntR family transcriptional repressor for pyruvate dehydrogenase complex